MPRRRFALGLIAVLSVVALPYLVTAQPDSARPASQESADRQRPLPNYFGKIAVNDQQREQLYKLQGDYETKIDALQQQIRSLLKERDQKMEALLTPGQKLRLQELREEAKSRAAQPDADQSDAAAKP